MILVVNRTPVLAADHTNCIPVTQFENDEENGSPMDNFCSLLRWYLLLGILEFREGDVS